VVFCPPLPYWSETQFNSTDNNFLSVVTYWCNDGYAFKGYSSKPGNETVLSTMCLASKQWYPAILDCLCTYMPLPTSISMCRCIQRINKRTALNALGALVLCEEEEIYLPRKITIYNKKNTILKLACSRLPEKQKSIYAGRQHC